MDKPFLNSYGGQTAAELISLKDSYRIDSLVLAFEQAIDRKAEIGLTDPERFILAIEAMEREVNNGGWDAFFLNTDSEFDTILVGALTAIGCSRAAQIAQTAIDAHLRGDELDDYEEMDKEYFENTESIENRLFEYIEEHASEIELTDEVET